MKREMNVCRNVRVLIRESALHRRNYKYTHTLTNRQQYIHITIKKRKRKQFLGAFRVIRSGDVFCSFTPFNQLQRLR